MIEQQPLLTVTGALHIVDANGVTTDVIIHPLKVKASDPDNPGLVFGLVHEEPEYITHSPLRITPTPIREASFEIKGRPLGREAYSMVVTNP